MILCRLDQYPIRNLDLPSGILEREKSGRSVFALPGLRNVADIMGRFSSILRDHLANPRNAGRLERADTVGRGGSPRRPPFMDVYLRIDSGIVREVTFETFGCGAAIAAGSMLTEMVKGRSVEDCLALTQKQLTDALGGLPADKTWCAQLAIDSMRSALSKNHG